MKILSFDIESTTGNHNDGSMCTFGYCVADETGILVQKDLVMRPYTNRFETKIKLHYDKEFIRSRPTFPAFYNEICSLFSSSDLIIGFSVMNDVEFLNNVCELYNLPKIEYEFIDVQLLYKTVYNKPTMTALNTIAEDLGFEYKPHRSDEDARVTLLTLKHIIDDLQMSIDEIFRKYHITAGINNNEEVTPCENGVLSKREINFLILDFIEKNRKHIRRYKGGLSYKTFAFSEGIRYGDVDFFRKVIKRIYELNGKIGSIDSSNVFVYKDEILEKEQKALNFRNDGKIKIKSVSLDELLEILGDLPNLDFSDDLTIIKQHRKEVKRQRQIKRLEKRRQMMLNRNNKQAKEKQQA